MGFIERILKYDTAVYWATRGKNQFGQPIYELPTEIGCRWQEEAQVVRDQSGQEHIFSAKVFVGIDVDLDAKLWHGKLKDLDSSKPPNQPPDDALVIKKFDKIPNIRNTKVVRTVYL